MQLSPIAEAQTERALDHLERALALDTVAAAAMARIAATRAVISLGADLPRHRADSVALAHEFGIATRDEPPAVSFSWDGHQIRTRTTASVVLHEIAHWQICPPDRRPLPDFGLGAGPETGDRPAADAAAATDFATRQREEVLASILGILWGAALGQPAMLAFLEQNWLEAWHRPATAAAIADAIGTLHARGLIDETGLPTRPAAAR